MDYPLWEFDVAPAGGTAETVWTRGRTSQEARAYIQGCDREATVKPCDSVMIVAAEQYSVKHAFDWLHRPPVYLIGPVKYEALVAREMEELFDNLL